MASFVNGIAVMAEGVRGTTGEYREFRPSEQDSLSSRERERERETRDKSARALNWDRKYQVQKSYASDSRNSSFSNNSTVKF